MRIAYFNANMRVGQDGVTRCLYKMIDGALERGHQAVAVTSTLPAGEPVIPMHKVRSVVLPLQKNYRIAVPRYSAFEPFITAFAPDILHINSPCTLGFAAMRYGRQAGIPVVATYHTHFPTYPRYYNLTRLEVLIWRLSRYFYNNVTCTLVPTRPIMQELEEHDIRGLRYLPNGVDLTAFGPHYRSEAWRQRFGGGTRPVVLFVSRLVWEKDLRDLAAMYATLRSRRNDFEFVVVGDGHARAEFEAMMPGAHFLGYQSGATLAESYASSDLFVFPSTTETFGLVTLEAMASQLVPVAANVGGAVEIVQDGRSGFLTMPHNGPDMADRVSWLLDRPEVRQAMARRALERAYEYDWNTILDRLFDVYAEVVRPAFTRRAAHAA